MNWHAFLKTFSKNERLALTGAIVVFAVSTTPWGITAFYNPTAPAPIEGGTYVEAIVGQPTTVNPLLIGENDADRDLVRLLFSSLEDLAESIEESSDHKTWLVTIKENLKWSAGEDIDSNDIIFTIETIQNPDSRSGLYSSWRGVIVEKITSREARFTLRSPSAFFGDNIRALQIAPRHIFVNIPVPNLRLSGYNLEPVGNGPYRFAGFDKTKNGFIESYRLETNPYYTRTKPLIKNFSIRFFTDIEKALQAFDRREVDGIGKVFSEDLEKIKIGYQLIELPASQYYAIFLNPSINAALKDINIRKALSLAVDRAQIIQSTLGEKGVPMDGPIPPFLNGYVPTEVEIFSIKEATKVLEAADWKLNENGLREKKNKNTAITLELSLIVPQTPFLSKVAEIIKEDWGKIGVKINLVLLNPKEVISDALRTRNYDMVLLGNALNNVDVFSFWHSSQRFSPGLNLALYENKKVDELLEKIRQEFDSGVRVELLAEMQNIIREDRPAIFLFSPTYLYAAIKSLGGFEPVILSTPSERFANINEWYVKTARVFK